MQVVTRSWKGIFADFASWIVWSPKWNVMGNVFHSHKVMGRHYCMETITLHFPYEIKGGNTVNKTSNLFEKNGMEFSLVVRLKDSLEGQKEKSLWVQIYFHPVSVLQWTGNSFEIRFFGVEILILPFSTGVTLEQMTPCLGIQSAHLWKDLPELPVGRQWE